MDVLASYSIFQELQLVHDTGYFSALPSLEETWQQVRSLISAHGRDVSGVLHEAMSSRGTTGNTQVQSPSNATTATGVFPGLTILPST
ncbi:KLF7 isoform 7 [Pan troglodytes]|uniref:KLF7 isoform 7 n=2 Tax=Homininae TaxID=207598 RepID=A0A2J8N5T9_PANTR|nr:KLF7 isoform 7 [Pan troglodytes]CCO02792.1 Kruppel-like factor 7 (ubiquitous) [Homo sapiens]